MPFRFNLEPVLKHRKRLEDEAQREFAEAQNAVEVCLREVEAMYARLDEVREEISSTLKSGVSGAIEQARALEMFIGGHKIRIEIKRIEARELLQKAEVKQEQLIHAARERKVLVKLKEKRLVEYREWLSRMEAKEQDDMTMVRHGRGRR